MSQRFHVGILTSHPIQYQAPWFRELAKVVDLEVFFAHRQSAQEQGRAGFGVAFDWDVDLLSGYAHQFLRNVSARPNVNHFAGCDTPEVADIISGRQKVESRKQKSETRCSLLPAPCFDAFIVAGWYLKSYRQAVRACRTAGVPVLVRGDSQLGTPRSRLKRLAMEVRQRWLLRQFDGFLSVGQRHREYLEHYGVPSKKIFFAPHFVDNEWFERKAEKRKSEKAEIRKKWGASEDTLVVLFVGKFQAIKRPGDILAAVAKLHRSRVRAVSVFVGSGELDSTLRQRASQLGVNTCFEGFMNQTELPAIYAAADVLVLPSESETWGLVVNEAMASGCPVIVSDKVGCGPDLVQDDVTGYVYPVGDTASLAGCLSLIARDQQLLARLAQGAKERVKAYSSSGAVDGLLKALAFAVGPRAART